MSVCKLLTTTGPIWSQEAAELIGIMDFKPLQSSAGDKCTTATPGGQTVNGSLSIYLSLHYSVSHNISISSPSVFAFILPFIPSMSSLLMVSFTLFLTDTLLFSSAAVIMSSSAFLLASYCTEEQQWWPFDCNPVWDALAVCGESGVRHLRKVMKVKDRCSAAVLAQNSLGRCVGLFVREFFGER